MNQKMQYISSFIKNKYDLPKEMSATAERIAYSITNGIENEKDYIDAMGKMIGDRVSGESVEKSMSMLDKINRYMG